MITVTTPGPVTITTTTLPDALAGTPYSQVLAAIGGATPYQWTVSAGTLPGGLTLATDGTLAGTPAAAGSFFFTAQVTDADGRSATQQLSLNVLAPLTVTTTALANATRYVAYSQTLAATGGTAPYAWSLASGPLPTGLTLSGSGVIGGTPTATGTFGFTVRVTDAVGGTATKALSIRVTAPLSISTTSLPNGTRAVLYSRNVTAVGSISPYTFTIASGTLPTGLTLSSAGLIRGIPTVVGTFSFTVRVVSSEGKTATRALSITIVEGTVPAPPEELKGSAVLIPNNTLKDSVTLTWGDNSSNESGFEVQRSTTADFAASTSYTVGANVVRFNEYVLRTSDYYYRVRAVNVVGPSAWSNTIFVTTP